MEELTEDGVVLSLPKNSSGLVSEFAGVDRGRGGGGLDGFVGNGMMSIRAGATGLPGRLEGFAVLGLLPMGDRNKDVEILALWHQIAVLERQLGQQRVHFATPDWALLAALLHHLPVQTLQRLRLLVPWTRCCVGTTT